MWRCEDLAVNQKEALERPTAINLAASLALADRSVLLVTWTPGNLTSGVGLKAELSQRYEALMGQCPCKLATVVDKMTCRRIGTWRGRDQAGQYGRPGISAGKCLAGVRDKCDYILIDTPPPACSR